MTHVLKYGAIAIGLVVLAYRAALSASKSELTISASCGFEKEKMKEVNYFRKIIVLVFASIFLPCIEAQADPSSAPCADALVQSTYNMHSSTDVRLASLVSQQTWNNESNQFGASAVLYGIPVGASYDSYHQNATQSQNRLNYSDTQVLDVAWTGIDPNSVTPYEACLKALASENIGPHLSVVAADAQSITLLVTWNNPGAGPTSVNWQPGNIQPRLPTTIQEGTHKITVKRPAQMTFLSMNTNNLTSETVTLEPVPLETAKNCALNPSNYVTCNNWGDPNGGYPEHILSIHETDGFPIFLTGLSKGRTYTFTIHGQIFLVNDLAAPNRYRVSAQLSTSSPPGRASISAARQSSSDYTENFPAHQNRAAFNFEAQSPPVGPDGDLKVNIGIDMCRYSDSNTQSDCRIDYGWRLD